MQLLATTFKQKSLSNSRHKPTKYQELIIDNAHIEHCKIHVQLCSTDVNKVSTLAFITFKLALDSELITHIPSVSCIPPSLQHWFLLFRIWSMIDHY
jgi:hypothetical protein